MMPGTSWFRATRRPGNRLPARLVARTGRGTTVVGMDVEAVSEPDAATVEAELRSLGLRYVSDGIPGITRRRSGSGFSYRAPDGSLIKDRHKLAWIRKLAIPPAWQDVWI